VRSGEASSRAPDVRGGRGVAAAVRWAVVDGGRERAVTPAATAGRAAGRPGRAVAPVRWRRLGLACRIGEDHRAGAPSRRAAARATAPTWHDGSDRSAWCTPRIGSPVGEVRLPSRRSRRPGQRTTGARQSSSGTQPGTPHPPPHPPFRPTRAPAHATKPPFSTIRQRIGEEGGSGEVRGRGVSAGGSGPGGWGPTEAQAVVVSCSAYSVNAANARGP
jgi:hypothetical protein